MPRNHQNTGIENHFQFGEDSDYVFVNLWSEPKGHPWAYPAVYDLVRRLRVRTGIDFGPHQYRHIVPA